MLSEIEKKNLTVLGKSISVVATQLERLQNGFPDIDIISPATAANGILMFSEDELDKYVSLYEEAAVDVVKFVPASGAASRMFKPLQSGLNQNLETEDVLAFSNAIKKFAFGDLVPKGLSPLEIVEYVLTEKGLNYSNLPKGLILFHDYKETARMPFEEQLFEACLYGTKKGKSKVHFTISNEHMETIKEVHNMCIKALETKFNTIIEIEYSEQKSETDTIAIDEHNDLVTSQESILFRPAGHGALIQNLNEINADIIFVKNIDNVVKASLIGDTITYKKALAGKLIELKNQIHELLDSLLYLPSETMLNATLKYIKDTLGVELELDATNLETNIHCVYCYLNRPIRVGGMVVNAGDPGGGPFWVVDQQFEKSLQIVEGIQLNMGNPHQVAQLNSATHFNPVDLVCYVKDHRGRKFNLLNFADHNAGLVAEKSVDGKMIKVLELPGLWNGAMANWITVFVDVPASTFNPVKTVFDLLKPNHQED